MYDGDGETIASKESDLMVIPNPDNSYLFTVKTIVDGRVVLRNDQDKEIRCPKSLLPSKINEGDRVMVSLDLEEEAIRRQKITAKELLREMLRDNG